MSSVAHASTVLDPDPDLDPTAVDARDLAHTPTADLDLDPAPTARDQSRSQSTNQSHNQDMFQ
jgi:hypothetical protein